MSNRGMAGARLITAGALVLGLSGCWLQPGQNAGHTYANPSESELTAANVADLEELWSVPVQGVVGEPVVSGERVYLAESATLFGRVEAFDTATGGTEWSETLITGNDGTQAIDVLAPAEIDGELWTGYSTSETFRSATTCRGERVRLDAATGARTGEEEGFGSSAVSSGDLVIQRQANVSQDCFSDSSAVVVREGQAESWRAALPGQQAADGEVGPTVIGDRVVVLFNDTIRAFPAAGCGAATCAPTWTYTVPFGTIPVGPIVAGPGGRVLFAQYDIVADRTYLMALSGATGNQDWRATVGVSIDGTQVQLALAGSNIYAVVPDGATRELQVYAASGCGAPNCTPLWTASTSAAGSTAHPVVAGGVVYVADADSIDAFPAGGCGSATCTAIASVPLDDTTALVVSGGRLYAVAGGTLTAFAPA